MRLRLQLVNFLVTFFSIYLGFALAFQKKKKFRIDFKIINFINNFIVHLVNIDHGITISQ